MQILCIWPSCHIGAIFDNNAQEHNNASSHLEYRPDIDGLRAIAVLAVIGFHSFPEFVRGGFVGVDVFFVIGYLISGIILKSMEESSFSISSFTLAV